MRVAAVRTAPGFLDRQGTVRVVLEVRARERQSLDPTGRSSRPDGSQLTDDRPGRDPARFVEPG